MGEPKPLSKPRYGTTPPDEDPENQRHIVEAHDGVDLYVETWLPAPKDGHTPPARIPTILIMTPYVSQGVEEYPESPPTPGFIDYFTARGYAVAQHHVRGTGESGGCLEQTAANQIDDGARVVEYLGKDAPWSDGNVGMYGASYDAETQISTAAFGDRDKVKYLKAIIPTASVGSQYDWNFMDGVPWAGQPAAGNAFYLAGTSLIPGQEPAPQHYPEKLPCQIEVMLSSADQNGDFTEYWQEREYRPGAPNVKAATLMVHGLRDFNVQSITLQGFFNRLPRTTPHKGIFGVWNHAFPSRHPSVEPQWQRSDWYDMVTAWFDRYLKGLDTKVESWPNVQVQASGGQWWVAKEFPNTGGPLGQLALGPEGTLGATKPKGETSFQEQTLWVMSSDSDAHVAAELEVLGRDGEPLHHEGSSDEAVATYGVRSLQHIEEMQQPWFNQQQSEPFPVDEAKNVVIRFLPTHLKVPKGGSLRLTISGSVAYSKGESLPSGTTGTITLLHDCRHASTLRFRRPSKYAQLINVREADELDRRLTSKPHRIGARTGGGIASAKVCGRAPRPHTYL